MNKAVIFDRDGTIIKEAGYIKDPKLVKILQGVVDGLDIIKKLGFLRIVLSNQSGIGRGLMTLRDVEKINWWMEDYLLKEGQRLDGIFFSIDPPWIDSKTRKPATGLLIKIIEWYRIDIKNLFIVGDKKDDILLARNIGAKEVLVLTGHGKETIKEIKPDLVFSDILSFANYLRDTYVQNIRIYI